MFLAKLRIATALVLAAGGLITGTAMLASGSDAAGQKKSKKPEVAKRASAAVIADRFKYRVPFEIGYTESIDGGRIYAPPRHGRSRILSSAPGRAHRDDGQRLLWHRRQRFAQEAVNRHRKATYPKEAKGELSTLAPFGTQRMPSLHPPACRPLRESIMSSLALLSFQFRTMKPKAESVVRQLGFF
jgi:hypothetical protein